MPYRNGTASGSAGLPVSARTRSIASREEISPAVAPCRTASKRYAASSRSGPSSSGAGGTGSWPARAVCGVASDSSTVTARSVRTRPGRPASRRSSSRSIRLAATTSPLRASAVARATVARTRSREPPGSRTAWASRGSPPDGWAAHSREPSWIRTVARRTGSIGSSRARRRNATAQRGRAGADLLGRRVEQHVHGPRLGHRGAVVQVPGHRTDRGALAHQLLGGGPVRLPAAPARPAAEHGVPQQRVGVPVQSVRVPAQQAEAGHRGEPAGDPVRVGLRHAGDGPRLGAAALVGAVPRVPVPPGPGAVPGGLRGAGGGRLVRLPALQHGQAAGDPRRGPARAGQPPRDDVRVGARVQRRAGVGQRGRRGLRPRRQVVQQGPQQQRVARPRAHAVRHPSGLGVRERGPHEVRGGAVAQRGEGVGVDEGGGQPVGQPVAGRVDVVLAALGDHEEHRQAVDEPGRLREPAARGRVGGVHVVDRDEQRAPSRVRLQQPPQQRALRPAVLGGGRAGRRGSWRKSASAPKSCRTTAQSAPPSSGTPRARSTRIPCPAACSAAALSSAVRPVPVAPRSRTSRTAPARARSPCAASRRRASSRSLRGSANGTGSSWAGRIVGGDGVATDTGPGLKDAEKGVRVPRRAYGNGLLRQNVELRCESVPRVWTRGGGSCSMRAEP